MASRLTSCENGLEREMVCRYEDCDTTEEYCPHLNESNCPCLQEILSKLAKYEDAEDQKQQTVCGKCFNARMGLDENLDDDNDFSSFSIGHGSNGFRMMYTSGYGKPPRIEVQQWDEKAGWHNVAIYYPRYCPECGREITEYEQQQ